MNRLNKTDSAIFSLGLTFLLLKDLPFTKKNNLCSERREKNWHLYRHYIKAKRKSARPITFNGKTLKQCLTAASGDVDLLGIEKYGSITERRAELASKTDKLHELIETTNLLVSDNENIQEETADTSRGTDRHVARNSKHKPELQPIRKAQKKTKLPPLKESLLPESGNRLPDICPQTRNHVTSRALDRTSEIHTPPCLRNESQQKRSNDRTIPHIRSNYDCNTSDSTCILNDNERTGIGAESLNKYSYGSSADENLSKPTIKLQNLNERPAWFDEREKLRQYKRQTETNKVKLKPLKATQTFKEKKHKSGRDFEKEMESKRLVIPDRTDIHASTARRPRNNINSEYMENKNVYLPPSTSGSLSHGCAGAVRTTTQRGTECNTKGVGFKSKSRLAKQKAEEEERMETERKEHARKEAMIPSNIRKNFKKYGFK